MNTLLKNTVLGIGALATTLTVVNCTKQKSTANSPTKPNIIYILADDLGYGDLGCYGQEKIETPNIDALANRGVKFTQHYSGAPVSAPSRCVLLTGKHLGHSQIRGNDEWASRGDVWDFAKASKDENLEGQRPLKTGTKTIASLLQQVGYKTAVIGKWGLGAPLTKGVPNDMGFDFFYGYNCQRQAHTYFPTHLWKNREKIKLNNKLVVPSTKLDKNANPLELSSYSNYSLKDYAPDLMQKEALDFIRRNKNNPFFFYYASPIPHVPLQAPKRWVDYYVKKFGDEKPYLGKKGYFPCRYPKATYAAMVSYLDEQVGEIISELKKQGIYDNTIVIFTSDNGPTYNGGSNSPWFNSGGVFNSEYGRGKGFVYEGGIRVPMIVTWPNKIKKSRDTDFISAFWDVLPTFCEIGGAKIPNDVDGLSFLPLLLNKKVKKKAEYYYWEYPEYGGQQALRMGKWKAVRKNIFKGNMAIELYNLENDILEKNDVSSENLEVISKIKEIFIHEHTESESNRFKITQLGDKKK